MPWLWWLSQRKTCTGYAVRSTTNKIKITRHPFQKTKKKQIKCYKFQKSGVLRGNSLVGAVGRRCWVAQAGASPGCLFEAPKPTEGATCKGYHSRRVKGSRQSKLAAQYHAFGNAVCTSNNNRYLHPTSWGCKAVRLADRFTGPFFTPSLTCGPDFLSGLHQCIHYDDTCCKGCMREFLSILMGIVSN